MLSRSLDPQIIQILESSVASGNNASPPAAEVEDPLDSQSFDHIAHINNIFPTEHSFAQVDTILATLQSHMTQMEKNMRELIREQSGTEQSADRPELIAAKDSIRQLHVDIKDIKDKALHAELTVHGITRDIKSLDCAKKNLVNTVTVLRRLQMLVTAVEQLRQVSAVKDYAAIAPLLLAVTGLSVQFDSFRGIPEVNDLLTSVTAIIAELKASAFDTMKKAFSTQGQLTGDPKLLHDICLAVDAMGVEIRQQLIDWYVQVQLQEYRAIFRPEDEVGNMENIARRFSFLKRICKHFDEEQVSIFPRSWTVSQLVCEKFCDITKEHILTLLGGAKGHSIDVKVFIKSLQTALEFEQGLNRRFAVVKGADNNIEVPDIFVGRISNAFESFMYIYIEAEDKILAGMVDKFKTSGAPSADEISEGVFTASSDLFFFYRQTLMNMAKLNTGKPFVDLSKLFGKWLSNFCDATTAKLPKEDRRNFSPDDIRVTCIILNTAEYCHNTTSQLEEKIKEKVSPILKDTIDMSHETEIFLLLVTLAIQSLVKQVSHTLTPSLQSMTKISWASMQNAGDQSEYISILAATLTKHLVAIRKLILNPKHLSWFCDKFVDYFVPLFVRNIYDCKPISEVGAEQMLLDVHALKTCLMDLPNCGADQKQPVSSAFTKFVSKGIIKAETLLKVVMTPLDPPEKFIRNYVILSSDQSTGADSDGSMTAQKIHELHEGLVKILDLKGVRKNTQQSLLDLLNKRLGGNGSLQISSFGGNASSASAPMSAMPALSNIAAGFSNSANQASPMIKNNISDAGVKFNQNFRKLAAAMDIKSNWMSGNSSNTKP